MMRSKNTKGTGRNSIVRHQPRQTRERHGVGQPIHLANNEVLELRILALSDVHTQDVPGLVQFLDRQDITADVVVYAGDGIGRFNPKDGPNYFEQLAARSTYGLFAITGNADGQQGQRCITGQHVYDLHRQPVLVGGLLFIGSEGAPTRPGLAPLGKQLYSEPAIRAHLREHLASAKNVRAVCIVSHAPPYGILDASRRHGEGHIGSTALRECIASDHRVHLVICGHSHVNGGKVVVVDHTEVLNVATHDGTGDCIRIARYCWRPQIQVVSGLPSINWQYVYPYDELMTLDGLAGVYAQKLWDAGLTTPEHVANATSNTIGAALGWKADTAARFKHLAQARLSQVPIKIAPIYTAPTPRIFFDIETDPWGGNRLCWCIGVLREDTGELCQFVAYKPEEERRMLSRFITYCKSLPRHSLVAYSGADFDRQKVMIRLRAHRLPIPSLLKDSIDVLHHVRRSIALPCHTYRLKDAAVALGYQFRHSDLDGYDIAAEYQSCVESNQPLPPRLLEYNEDDVRAVHHVIAKIETLCGYGGEPLPTKRLSGAARRKLRLEQ